MITFGQNTNKQNQNGNGQTKPAASQEQRQPTPPTHRIRVGSVTASIWEQISDDQNSLLHGVKFQRSYQVPVIDRTTGQPTGELEWKNTETFPAGGGSLLQLAKAADQADTWCNNRRELYKQMLREQRAAQQATEAAYNDHLMGQTYGTPRAGTGTATNTAMAAVDGGGMDDIPFGAGQPAPIPTRR